MAPFAGTTQKCKSCEKTVYFVDQLTADDKVYHKACFRCHHCKGTLKVSYIVPYFISTWRSLQKLQELSFIIDISSFTWSYIFIATLWFNIITFVVDGYRYFDWEESCFRWMIVCLLGVSRLDANLSTKRWFFSHFYFLSWFVFPTQLSSIYFSDNIKCFFVFCSGVQIEIMILHLYSSASFLDHFNWMVYRWGCLDPLMLDVVCPSWLMIGHFLSAMKFACGSSIFEWWSGSSAPHRLPRGRRGGAEREISFSNRCQTNNDLCVVKKQFSVAFVFVGLLGSWEQNNGILFISKP